MLRGVVVVAIIGILALYIYPSKKSDLPTTDKPFKTKNANRIWAKAKEVLLDSDLRNLYDELLVKDKELLQWKEANRNKDVKDTAGKEKLLAAIKSMKEKYNLDGSGTSSASVTPTKFKDSRLQSVWNEVSKSPYYHPYELDVMLQEMDTLQSNLDKIARETADDSSSSKREY